MAKFAFDLPGKGSCPVGIFKFPDVDPIDPSVAHRGLSYLSSRIARQASRIAHGLFITGEGGDLHDILGGRERSSSGDTEDRNLHKSRPGANDSNPVGRLPGEIDDASGDERSPIVDKDIHRSAVGEVCDLDLRSQGKGSMSGGQIMLVKNRSACRFLSVKGRTIPRGPADLGHAGRG